MDHLNSVANSVADIPLDSSGGVSSRKRRLEDHLFNQTSHLSVVEIDSGGSSSLDSELVRGGKLVVPPQRRRRLLVDTFHIYKSNLSIDDDYHEEEKM